MFFLSDIEPETAEFVFGGMRRRMRNRRRIRKLKAKAKGTAGYVAGQIRDAAVQTAGLGLIGAGIAKLRPKIGMSHDDRGLIQFADGRKLTRAHRKKISRSLRLRGAVIDRQLKRVDTITKSFRQGASGLNALAAAKKYRSETARVDSLLRRSDRATSALGRVGRGGLAVADRVMRRRR